MATEWNRLDAVGGQVRIPLSTIDADLYDRRFPVIAQLDSGAVQELFATRRLRRLDWG